MPAKHSKGILWAKMLAVSAGVCIGGPALVMYISPTEEQLVERYNPELRARSKAGKHERQQEFDDYVVRLKEYSKSDKPIWLLQAEDAKKAKEEEKLRAEFKRAEEAKEAKARRAAIRREAGLPAEEEL